MVQNSPFARKIASFVRLGADELQAVSELYQRRRKFAPGLELVHQGEIDQSAFIMADGWAFSYKILADGERQIVNFQIPGDFLGVRSMLFRNSDHNVEPITPIEASEVSKNELFQTFAKTPRLATAVLWAVSRDEAMVVEHLVGVGQRPAAERTAHLLLELNARLRLVGLGDKTGFACPLTQYHLADAVGLSAVHVNRVLREIREAGLMTFQNGRVTFDDYEGLVDFADFDRSYLDQDGPVSPY
ncbi:Crp/Fnr family transcriptional regulator [Rhodobacter ferrooxidans]|uniref:Crp/Fnr family transcriptional regulator n=1 Tax=Rhodobacter ferrooxidans TaxID=371731 RepID=UPI0005952A3C|nr:Crp/Fnr family transcriptional regulator [Rhodobacter sp. SW2]